MRAKDYLLLKNKNICKFELNPANVDNFLDILTEKIKAHYNFFILSFSGLDDSVSFAYLKRARQLIAEYGALFIISKRADFAHCLKSDGIYLDETALDFKFFKEIFSDNFIVAAPVGSSVQADIYIE